MSCAKNKLSRVSDDPGQAKRRLFVLSLTDDNIGNDCHLVKQPLRGRDENASHVDEQRVRSIAADGRGL
jgi:hypothetical protein